MQDNIKDIQEEDQEFEGCELSVENGKGETVTCICQ